MPMRQVLDTLGDTWYVIGQASISLYYYVDSNPLRIDFGSFSDPYPFSGKEMKQLFDSFGAVTVKTIVLDDLKRLKKGMTMDEIVETLGNTIETSEESEIYGDGLRVVNYTVFCGMWNRNLTFSSTNGKLPYTGEEIYTKVQDEQGATIEISW